MKSKATLRHFLCIAGSSLLAIGSASAQTTYTWTNITGGNISVDWALEGNWASNTPYVSGSSNELAFFSDSTTNMAAGTRTFTNVPTTLSLNTLTLNGKGPSSGASGANFSIGTNASTWTIGDGTTSTVNLNANFGATSAAGFNYTIGANLDLNQAVTTFTGDGTGGFTFSGTIADGDNNYGITKSGTSALVLSGANTYGGGTTLTGGLVRIGRDSVGTAEAITSSAIGTGTLTFNDGGISSNGTTARTILNAVNFTGNAVLGDTSASGKLTFDGATSLGAAVRTLTVNSEAEFTANIDDIGGGITKAGAGTLILSGTNSYTGGTTVTAGTLVLSGANSFTGGTTVTAGRLALTGSMSGGGAVSTSGTGVLDQSASGVISGASSFTQGSSGTSILSGANSHTGGTTVTAGTLVLSGTNSFTGGTTMTGGILSVSAAANLGVAGSNLVFDGGTLQITGNTLTSISGLGRTVVFNSGKTVGLDIASATNTFTANQLLDQGTGGLTKSGVGTLVLNQAHTYTGTTTVSAGTLNLGGSTANGSLDSTVLTMTGGTFSYTRTGGTTQSFTTTNINGGGTSITTVAGNTLNLGNLVKGTRVSVDFGTAGTITTTRANDSTGIIGGWATFGGDNWAVANGASSAITGFAGTYTLTSAAGNTAGNYNALNMSVDSSQTLGAVITPNTLNFRTAGAYTLTLTGTTNTINSDGIMVTSAVGNNASVITGGSLRSSSNGSLNIIQNNTSNTLTIGSIIVNNSTSGLVKSGAGKLILTGVNTYTGNTVINGGNLEIGGAGNISANTIISGDGSLTWNSSTTATLNSGNTFSGGFNLNSGIVGTIGVGNYTGFGTGLLTLNGGQLRGTNTTAATIIENDVRWNNLVTFGRPSGGQPIFTFNGNVTLDGAVGVTGTGTEPISLTINGNIGEATVGSSFSFNPSGAAGSPVLTLNGQNTFTGNITSSGVRPLVIGGSGYLGGGNYAGNISIGTSAFTYSSSAHQILSGSNSMGATTITAGILQFGKTSALYSGTTESWTAANIRVNAGGTLAFNVGGTNEFTTGNVTTLLTNLAASNSATNGMAAGSNFGFDTTNAAGGSFTIGNVIANSGGTAGGARGLTKLGTGTLELTADNTYTGATSITAGTLLINGSTSSTSVVTVASGATLGGSGTVGGATTVAGFLNPGNSPGVLSFGDSLVMESTATTTMEILGLNRDTQYDGIDVATSLTYGGSLILNFGSTFGADHTFNLFNFASQDGSLNSVTLAGLYSGSLVNNGFGVWGLTDDNDNNWTFTQSTGDLNLVVIPEPRAALLGGLGVLLLLRRRR
jgi:autotransporter-associated beta strand protein